MPTTSKLLDLDFEERGVWKEDSALKISSNICLLDAFVKS
jgi:hypothetical protein